MTTPTEAFRSAAKLLKERAAAATEGPWWSDDSDDCWRLHGVAFRTPPFRDGDGPEILPAQVVNKQILKAPKHSTPYAEYWPDAADAAWITTVHPLVGLALADLLERFAACRCDEDCDHWAEKSAALKVAHLVLGVTEEVQR